MKLDFIFPFVFVLFLWAEFANRLDLTRACLRHSKVEGAKIEMRGNADLF